MLKTGSIVLYGSQGICKISEITTKKVGKISAQYYVIKPIYADNTVFFVPIENEVLTARIQSVMSKSQAEKFVDSLNEIEPLKNMDEAEKRKEYKEALSSNDRQRLVAVIKTLRAERDLRRESNKKLNINDEQILYKAEQLLYSELAFAMEITPQEVVDAIKF